MSRVAKNIYSSLSVSVLCCDLSFFSVVVGTTGDKQGWRLKMLFDGYNINVAFTTGNFTLISKLLRVWGPMRLHYFSICGFHLTLMHISALILAHNRRQVPLSSNISVFWCRGGATAPLMAYCVLRISVIMIRRATLNSQRANSVGVQHSCARSAALSDGSLTYPVFMDWAKMQSVLFAFSCCCTRG